MDSAQDQSASAQLTRSLRWRAAEWLGLGLLLVGAALVQRQTQGIERGLLSLPLLLAGVALGSRRRWPLVAGCLALAFLGAFLRYPVPAWSLWAAALGSLLALWDRPRGQAPPGLWTYRLPAPLADLCAFALTLLAGYLDLRAGSLALGGGLAAWASRGKTPVAVGPGVAALALGWAWLRIDPALVQPASLVALAAGLLGLRAAWAGLRSRSTLHSALAGSALLCSAWPLPGALLELCPWLGDYDLLRLSLWGATLYLVARRAERTQRGARARAALRVLLGLGLVVSLVLAGSWIYWAREWVGSIDFHYYLCTARDRVFAPDRVPEVQFFYSPGCYWLWGATLRFSDSLITIQRVALGLLVVDALVVGLVLWRLSRSAVWGVLGGLWALRVLSQLEGLAACAEPWVVLWALVAVLIWRGQPLRATAKGRLQALAVGFSLGFCVFGKQQGLLLAGGASLFLVAPLLDPRYSWSAVLCGAIGLPAGYFLPVLGEGRGLVPAQRGFLSFSDYDSHGTWLGNLWNVARTDPSVWVALLLCAGGIATLWIRRRERAAAGERSLEPAEAVLLFSLLAFAFSLIQFQRRPYLHYAQLSAPFLILAGCTSAILLGRLGAKWSQGARAPALGCWLGLVALFGSAQGYGFTAGPRPTPTPPRAWADDPAMSRDIATLAALVEPGSELLILPPGRNVLHWRLQTRSLTSPIYYGWHRFPKLASLDWSTLDYVVVLRRDEDWSANFKDSERALVAQELPRSGLQRLSQTETLELWGRPR